MVCAYISVFTRENNVLHLKLGPKRLKYTRRCTRNSMLLLSFYNTLVLILFSLSIRDINVFGLCGMHNEIHDSS